MSDATSPASRWQSVLAIMLRELSPAFLAISSGSTPLRSWSVIAECLKRCGWTRRLIPALTPRTRTSCWPRSSSAARSRLSGYGAGGSIAFPPFTRQRHLVQNRHLALYWPTGDGCVEDLGQEDGLVGVLGGECHPQSAAIRLIVRPQRLPEFHLGPALAGAHAGGVGRQVRLDLLHRREREVPQGLKNGVVGGRGLRAVLEASAPRVAPADEPARLRLAQ